MAFIGIDLGGTKIRGAIAGANAQILYETVVNTASNDGGAVTQQIIAMCAQLQKESHAKGKKVIRIAVGTPGLVTSSGTINFASNITGFHKVSLGPALCEALGVPVVIENDANAAAIGEGTYGAAINKSNYAVLTIGTGTGLGLVVDGRLLRGHRGGAGEVAFLPFGANPATKKSRTSGALETAVAGPALQRLARSLRRSSPHSALPKLCTAHHIFDIPHDPVSTAVISYAAELIAQAIAAIAALTDPELIILAGGIGARPELVGPVRNVARTMLPSPVSIESSTLGARSGVLGALALAMSSTHMAGTKA